MSGFHGRSAAANPPNRFLSTWTDIDPEYDDEPVSAPQTEFFPDASRSIIARNTSPDLLFDASINPYRGCEHGCAYCYARPTHEYLGFSAGLDFESKIMVKHEAPALLRAELMKRSWKPQLLAMSGVTDPYQPIERELEITRGCLAVLAEFRNPVGIVTKNALVRRDIDHLAALAEHGASLVLFSVTSLDNDLIGRMEPRTSRPAARLRAMAELSAAGVRTGVMIGPCIPGLTDQEVPQILQAAAEAGATQASLLPIRLPGAVAPLFVDWLERHYPDRKDKVLNHIREMRGGKLNVSDFGKRFQAEGQYMAMVKGIFKAQCRKLGLNKRDMRLSTAAFQRPGEQLGLFG